MTNNSYKTGLTRRVYRLLSNLRLDLRYGGFLGGVIPPKYEGSGAYVTANSDYGVLPYLFDKNVDDDDVLVDVGCGKGRVINWWLYKQLGKRIVGIELNPDVSENTRARLSCYPNVEIRTGNVLDCFPAEGTIFYLFNPFNNDIMTKFKDLFIERVQHPKRAKIIYYNCLHRDVFDQDSRFIVEELSLEAGNRFHEAVLIRPA